MKLWRKLLVKTKELRFRILIGTIVLMMGALLAVAVNNPRANPSLSSDFQPAIEIREDIPVIFYDGQKEYITLPERVRTKEPFRVELDLAGYGEVQGKSLCVHVEYVNFSCLADGKEIYQFEGKNTPFMKSGGYSLHMIDLPSDLNNKVITLFYEPSISTVDSYKIATISYGNRTNIILSHLRGPELLTMIFLLMLFFIFLMTFTLTLVNRKKKNFDNKLLYVGLLCLFVACYFAAQMWIVLYLMYDQAMLVYFLEYFSFMLLPLPAQGMLRRKLNPKFDRWINTGIYLTIGNFIFQCGLFVWKNVEFRQMISITHFILIFNVIVSVGSIVLTKNSEYPEKKFLMTSLAPLWINVVIAVFAYIIYGRVMYVPFLLLVVVVFISIQIYHIIKDYNRIENEKIKNTIYREMAFIDSMTGLKNRRAYEGKMESKEQEKESFWIITLDINFLKTVNDIHGHQWGDELIKVSADILKQVFSVANCHEIFRVGGDEFIVFLQKPRTFPIEKLIDEIHRQEKRVSAENPKIRVEFAVGYHFYAKEAGITLTEAIHQADLNMYENKAKMKHRSSIRRDG